MNKGTKGKMEISLKQLTFYVFLKSWDDRHVPQHLVQSASYLSLFLGGIRLKYDKGSLIIISLLSCTAKKIW